MRNDASGNLAKRQRGRPRKPEGRRLQPLSTSVELDVYAALCDDHNVAGRQARTADTPLLTGTVGREYQRIAPFADVLALPIGPKRPAAFWASAHTVKSFDDAPTPAAFILADHALILRSDGDARVNSQVMRFGQPAVRHPRAGMKLRPPVCVVDWRNSDAVALVDGCDDNVYVAVLAVPNTPIANSERHGEILLAEVSGGVPDRLDMVAIGHARHRLTVRDDFDPTASREGVSDSREYRPIVVMSVPKHLSAGLNIRCARPRLSTHGLILLREAA